MRIWEIEKLVNDLSNDKLSGSSALGRVAVDCLGTFAELVLDKHGNMTPDTFYQSLQELARDLIEAQPTMAVVLTGVNHVLHAISEEYNTLDKRAGLDQHEKLEYLCNRTRAVVEEYLLRCIKSVETIGKSYRDILSDNDIIMTNSASGVVETVFNTAYDHGMDITVYAPESRPMDEGRILAHRLSGRGIKSILIVDSAMTHFLDKCTKVIVGADRITPTMVINKIGTRGLGLAAKELEIPMYCVCETAKFVPDLASFEVLNPLQPEEQLESCFDNERMPTNLIVENIYFDCTPLEHFKEFLTEHGTMDRTQVRQYITGVKIIEDLLIEKN